MGDTVLGAIMSFAVNKNDLVELKRLALVDPLIQHAIENNLSQFSDAFVELRNHPNPAWNGVWSFSGKIHTCSSEVMVLDPFHVESISERRVRVDQFTIT